MTASAPPSETQARPERRGQLLLVTSIALAVLLVSLAIIMNTAIYTENLATRGSDTAGSQDANRLREAATTGVSTVLSSVNEKNATTHAALTANVSDGVQEWSSTASRLYAASGSGVHVSLTRTTNGTRIEQESQRSFTNASGNDTDWTLVSAVRQTRAFRMNVSNDDLEASGPSEFRVIVDNGTHTWRLNVTQDAGDIVVGIRDGDGNEGTCVDPADHVWINVTDGTVGGDPCDQLTFAAPLTSAYRIEYHNPANVSGTYRLIVDNASLATNPAPHFNDSTGPSPYVAPAIYSVQLDVDYETPRLHYNTTVRVAPGEPE